MRVQANGKIRRSMFRLEATTWHRFKDRYYALPPITWCADMPRRADMPLLPLWLNPGALYWIVQRTEAWNSHVWQQRGCWCTVHAGPGHWWGCLRWCRSRCWVWLGCGIDCCRRRGHCRCTVVAKTSSHSHSADSHCAQETNNLLLVVCYAIVHRNS